MNFVTSLPRSPKGNNAVWVVVDCLTKSTHFIPFRVGQPTELLAEKYMREMFDYMEFQLVSCRTETRRSDHIFGKAFKKV